MSGSRKLLIVAGLALMIWGMGYGLYYAIFDEHQTLEQMGGSLAVGFMKAAEGDMDAAHAQIDTYASTKFEYVREVDVHSHWTALAMLLLLFGVIFDRIGFAEPVRFKLAVALVVGSVVFPLGVILQVFDKGIIPQVVAAVGAGVLILGLGTVVWGVLRQDTPVNPS